MERRVTDTRVCPFCGEPRHVGGRFCPKCGNRYPEGDEPDVESTEPTEWVRSARREPVAAGPSVPVEEPTTIVEAEPPRPRRSAPGTGLRILLGTLGVALGALALGYALYRFGVPFLDARRPDPEIAIAPVASPTRPQGAAPSPSPSSSPATVLVGPSGAPTQPRVRVANTDGDGANMRQDPSTGGAVIRLVEDGTVLDLIGEDRQADGRTWRNVRTPEGAAGWIVSDFLAPE